MSVNNDKWIELLKLQFNAKQYHIDMVRDFCEIVVRNLTLFDNDEFETEIAKEDVRLLAGYCKLPLHRYRIYLVSGIRFFSAAWLTNSTDDFAKFRKSVENEFSSCELMQIEGLDPNLVTTLFIFENDKITLAEHMYPSHLAWLLEKLSKVNLIRIE